MQLFYTPNIGTTETLLPQESHHAIKVLRLKTGDTISVVDGAGNLYKASVLKPDPRACTLTINEVTQNYGPLPYSLHMAVAPTKNIDRFEWFLEKATEIGIDQITPLLCEHSERKVLKQERLERVLVSAMKQSLKASLPKLNGLTLFNDFVSKANPSDNLMIAHCMESTKQTIKSSVLAKGNTITILVGPEGDFSPEEIESALQKGFSPITLGESRFRTETAAVVACHSVYDFFL